MGEKGSDRRALALRLNELEADRRELAGEKDVISLHPNAAECYRQKVADVLVRAHRAHHSNVGPYRSTIRLSVLAVPDHNSKTQSHRKKKRKRVQRVWRAIDISAFGVLSHEVWELLRERIDERCKAEDTLRRRTIAAGKKMKGPPPVKEGFGWPPDMLTFDVA